MSGLLKFVGIVVGCAIAAFVVTIATLLAIAAIKGAVGLI